MDRVYYLSPGTNVRQLSWFTARPTLGLRNQLAQPRAAKASPGKKPALRQLGVTQSATLLTAGLCA